MSQLTFFYPVLDALSDGRIIRKSMALALRIFGVLFALAALISVVIVLKGSFAPTVPSEMTVGTLLLSLILLAGAACVVQICFYRSKTVSELDESPFTVIPIVSVLFRWLGEIYATMLLALGASGCLFMWIANVNPMAILGSLGFFAPAIHPSVTSAFLAGIMWLIEMAILAFIAVVVAYFFAETSLVLAEIAHNTRALWGTAPPAPVHASRAVAAAAPVSVAPPTPPPGAVVLCPTCGSVVEQDAAYCGNCGWRP